VWVSDHVMEGDRYRLEPWTQLSWIAARFPGVRLGHNVLSNSYRHPPLMAKMAASLQELSGGRFILGYGAGWLEPEYRAYGWPFPPAKVRIAQMEEAVRLMRVMWTQSPATFEGEWYQVRDAYCEPRPVPRAKPIGGSPMAIDRTSSPARSRSSPITAALPVVTSRRSTRRPR